MDEWSVLRWFGEANYRVMLWANTWYWPTIWLMVFVGALIGMTPLRAHNEHGFIQIVFIAIRKIILWSGVILLGLPFVMMYVYDSTTGRDLAASANSTALWFWQLTRTYGWGVIPAFFIGAFFRIIFHRFVEPMVSKVLKTLRNQQTDDVPSDVREEAKRFQAKDFLPQKHYKKGHILVGLDESNTPIYIPVSTWRETNTQLIGPTRYGKGVIIGCLIDQAAKIGDGVIYIDPKADKFAPHIMYAAARAMNKPFYYVALHDGAPGAWSPFEGGTERDALARVEIAFALQETGDPGTDYYKSLEKQHLATAFRSARDIVSLAKQLGMTEANKTKAQLAQWSHIASLCPKGQGFSIAQAMQEGALVYVQGSLDDAVVRTATKVFIVECIQEARRLKDSRPGHLTLIVDELRFLVSKQLADALATVVGFNVNVVTAYQSTKDLLAPDDRTLNGQSLFQSINVNSQIKAVYGGADFDTADWVSKLSGTVQKQVTKFERTEIRASGGEIWDKARMVGAAEEQLITVNTVLTLPPRVCVLIQPRELAQVTFTSFIPVADEGALGRHLSQNAPTEAPASDAAQPEEVSLAKPDQKPKAAKKADAPVSSDLAAAFVAKASGKESKEAAVSQAKSTADQPRPNKKKRHQEKAPDATTIAALSAFIAGQAPSAPSEPSETEEAAPPASIRPPLPSTSLPMFDELKSVEVKADMDIFNSLDSDKF